MDVDSRKINKMFDIHHISKFSVSSRYVGCKVVHEYANLKYLGRDVSANLTKEFDYIGDVYQKAHAIIRQVIRPEMEVCLWCTHQTAMKKIS